MQYSCSVEVPLNREDCINLWFDESKLNQWQDGFKSKEWVIGKPNAVNSISQILLEQNGRKLELEERVLVNDLPDSFTGEYVHIHMTNTQKVIFEPSGVNSTIVTTEVNYTKFNALVVKIMAWIFPSIFKKQSLKWLYQFEELAIKESRNLI